jgi:hypothetical protein
VKKQLALVMVGGLFAIGCNNPSPTDKNKPAGKPGQSTAPATGSSHTQSAKPESHPSSTHAAELQGHYNGF